jgi:hypothetical protein
MNEKWVESIKHVWNKVVLQQNQVGRVWPFDKKCLSEWESQTPNDLCSRLYNCPFLFHMPQLASIGDSTCAVRDQGINLKLARYRFNRNEIKSERNRLLWFSCFFPKNHTRLIYKRRSLLIRGSWKEINSF